MGGRAPPAPPLATALSVIVVRDEPWKMDELIASNMRFMDGHLQGQCLFQDCIISVSHYKKRFSLKSDINFLPSGRFFMLRSESRAACAQSFAPWQQATIEITRRDHSIIACSRHICMVLFFTHIPFVVNRTINATPPERLQHSGLIETR